VLRDDRDQSRSISLTEKAGALDRLWSPVALDRVFAGSGAGEAGQGGAQGGTITRLSDDVDYPDPPPTTCRPVRRSSTPPCIQAHELPRRQRREGSHFSPRRQPASDCVEQREDVRPST